MPYDPELDDPDQGRITAADLLLLVVALLFAGVVTYFFSLDTSALLIAGGLGIDYGLGRTNIDTRNGIRYGVISQHSLADWFYDEYESVYGEPHCPKCGNEAKVIPCHTESSDPPGQWVSVIQNIPEAYEEYEINGCGEYACEDCEYLFDGDRAFGDEPIGHKLENEEYLAVDCLDSDVMIIRSPFYTYAPFCSPCVPGAGNLDSAKPWRAVQNNDDEFGGVKTYCFSHDYFEDHKAPYRVFRVADDQEVFPEV